MFNVIKNIYTQRNSLWIEQLDVIPSPVIINKFLSMNDRILNYVKYLNQYTYNLTPKHFLYLAWATIPKYSQAPYCKYIKSNKEDDLYLPIWKKIRKVLEMSDNDFNFCRPILLKEINSNKKEWFTKLGMNKDFWTKHSVNYEEMKTGEKREGKGGLELFGL